MLLELKILEDLKLFESVRNAELYLIETKIEEILRINFENWLQILSNEIK